MGRRLLAEAAEMGERARQMIAAAATATVDGVSVKRFDPTAAAAAAAIADGVSVETLSRWSELADNASSAALAGLQSLEQYRDAEDLIATNGVDGSTLDSVSS